MADNAKYYVIRGDKVLFESLTKEEILTAIMQAVEQGEIHDVDTGFVTSIQEQNHNAALKFWRGTNAEYNALQSVDPNTFYILTDAPDHTHTILDNDLQITGKLTVDDKIVANDDVEANSRVIVEGEMTVNDDIFHQSTHGSTAIFHGQNGDFSNNLRVGGGSGAFVANDDFVRFHGGIVEGRLAEIQIDLEKIGWRTLTLETGTTANAKGGSAAPMYRKVGDRVEIAGAVQLTWSGSGSVLIGTLPSGFRPANTVYKIAPMASNSVARIFVNSSGELKVEWMRKLSDGSAVTDADTWVQLNINFNVI